MALALRHAARRAERLRHAGTDSATEFGLGGRSAKAFALRAIKCVAFADARLEPSRYQAIKARSLACREVCGRGVRGRSAKAFALRAIKCVAFADARIEPSRYEQSRRGAFA